MTAAVISPPPRSASEFAGLGTVSRLVLRHDRVRLAVWVAGITLLVVTTASSYASRYPTVADRAAIGDAFRLPATVALVGPYRGGDPPTYGALVTQAALGLAAVLAALMSVFTVVRHTRAEEESGRAELLAAGPIGRHTPLTAALAVAIGADVAVGVLIAVLLPAIHVASISTGGSVLFGASVAGVGLVFAGVAAITAQISEYGRGASGLAGAVLGLAYALRAIGDVGPGWLSWLSPIGWAQRTDAFTGDRAWPLLLLVISAAVLMGAAAWLRRHRDLGTGLVPPAPGPPNATAALGHPVGLALRLQRTIVVAWAGALAAFALAYGSILGGADDLLRQISTLRNLVLEGSTITDSFAATLVLVFAILIGVFAVQAVLKLHSEEAAGRAEVVLAAAVPRRTLLGSHLLIALAGSAGLLAVAGAGLGVGAALSLHDAAMVARLTGASLAYIPALWVVAGFAVAVVGVAPRRTWLAWLGVAYPFGVYYAASYLDAPGWVQALSPYSHVPLMPAESIRWTPLLGLTVVAAGLIAVAMAAFRRRDVMVS